MRCHPEPERCHPEPKAKDLHLLLRVSFALLALPLAASAQSRADSALVGRILVAEDRRDSTDAALADGARHADARIRVIAQRARGRITDAKFAARDSLPPLSAPPVYAEPAWRVRMRSPSGRVHDEGGDRRSRRAETLEAEMKELA